MEATGGHHQTCLAHLLRDLNGLNERYPDQQWSGSFKKLLCDAMDLNRDGHGETPRSREAIVLALEDLLERLPVKKHRMHLLQAHVQGKTEPVHLPMYP